MKYAPKSRRSNSGSHALLMNLFHTLMVVSGSILLQDAGPKQEPGILRQKVVLVVLGRVG
jgi:hypothetical protein